MCSRIYLLTKDISLIEKILWEGCWKYSESGLDLVVFCHGAVRIPSSKKSFNGLKRKKDLFKNQVSLPFIFIVLIKLLAKRRMSCVISSADR